MASQEELPEEAANHQLSPGEDVIQLRPKIGETRYSMGTRCS
jgi:hypothetical protein